MKFLHFLTLAVLMLNASLDLKADQSAPITNTLSSRITVLDSPKVGGMSVGLADIVEAGLQKEGLAVYDRNFVRVWLGERELSRSGAVDWKTLRQAKLPLVDLFVCAEVQPAGTNQFSLTLEAVRAADAVTVFSLKADGRYPQEWLPALDRLVHELSQQIQNLQAADGKLPPSRAITWMPEASLWFFRGMDGYAKGDYAQALVAFRRARRWEDHFRLAWLWEARCYRQMGFVAQAGRVLEAARLSEQPVGQAAKLPIFSVVAGNDISPEEKNDFARQLAGSGEWAALDPRWIGASTREVDLQLTGEMAAHTTTGNAWLMLDEFVTVERVTAANGRKFYQARQQDVLTGKMEAQAEVEVSTNGLDQLAQRLLNHKTLSGDKASETVSTARATNQFNFNSSFDDAENEIIRCLDRAWRNPANARALLAAADACMPWETDVIYHAGKQERGVEWRVRGEFLNQAIKAIRQNPSQPEASFLLTAALWRQRYTPEFGIWAGSFSNEPLQEQMKPLLELFPQSAEATNLSERISENVVHNRRSLPADNRYLEPLFPAEMNSATVVPAQIQPADAEEKKQVFLSAFYQGQIEQATAAYFQLATNSIAPPAYEQGLFLDKVLAGKTAPPEILRQLDQAIQTPDAPAAMRFPGAYKLAMWHYQNGDYFRATELLRNLVNDDASAQEIVSWGGNNCSTTIADQAYDLLKHLRLFADGAVDFNRCCGETQLLQPPDATTQAALDKLFQQRMSLAIHVGRPNAEQMDHDRQEMRRIEKIMVTEYRVVLPAFLQTKILQLGPGPETMGLCAILGTNALSLLPQIVSGVCQQGNPSTCNNALNALGNIGNAAAAALPVVILAGGNNDAIMIQPAVQRAIQRLGTAPRRSVPYLARLLYHPNEEVALNASKAIFAAASLPPEMCQGLNDDELILRLQNWWENTGSWQSW